MQLPKIKDEIFFELNLSCVFNTGQICDIYFGTSQSVHEEREIAVETPESAPGTEAAGCQRED